MAGFFYKNNNSYTLTDMRFGKSVAFQLLMALMVLFTACEDTVDLEEGNLTQEYLNKEKYNGIHEEFWSGKEKDWMANLWEYGTGAAAEGRITCFKVDFPKCKNLFATVPMYKEIDITANGVKCQLRDMLADKYSENLILQKVMLTSGSEKLFCAGNELDKEWNMFTFGSYEKLDYSTFNYVFPANPSHSARYFILYVSYSNQYEDERNPGEYITPVFELKFRQLGNNNHNTYIE